MANSGFALAADKHEEMRQGVECAAGFSQLLDEAGFCARGPRRSSWWRQAYPTRIKTFSRHTNRVPACARVRRRRVLVGRLDLVVSRACHRATLALIRRRGKAPIGAVRRAARRRNTFCTRSKRGIPRAANSAGSTPPSATRLRTHTARARGVEPSLCQPALLAPPQSRLAPVQGCRVEAERPPGGDLDAIPLRQVRLPAIRRPVGSWRSKARGVFPCLSSE